jgi:hypothetical protein
MENSTESVDKSGTKQPSDATSSKTLSDLEEDKKVTGTSKIGGDTAPSPDGQFDEGSEKEKAGPM